MVHLGVVQRVDVPFFEYALGNEDRVQHTRDDFEPVYRGVDGFLQFLGRLSEAFEEFRWVPEEYFDAGDDVVVFIRMISTGRQSGMTTEQPMAHVCTMRHGKLVKHETFWERSAAREAAGLPD